MFIIGGGLDFVTAAFNGMQFPSKATALSPIAVMLSIFGLTGTYLTYDSSRNSKVNKKLAEKQQTVGFIMLLVVALLFELTFRVATS